MHSSASRAIDGTSSVRRACEVPNLRIMSEARNELSASAASSGTVIMGSSPLSLQPRVRLPMRKPKTLGHAAPLSGCVDADAVLPLLSHAEVQCKLRPREARISADRKASG